MNKKFLGSSFDDHLIELDSKFPGLIGSINEYNAKISAGVLIKKAREKKHISQGELAKKAHVPQSVISRIESPASSTMPRLDLLSKLSNAMGYTLVFSLQDKKTNRKRALSFAS